MAENVRTMPHQRGRGPRPKLDHPGQTLGRVLKYVGRKYWLHLIFVVVSIFVSVFAMVQGTLFTKTLIDSYILPLVQQVQAGQTADFTGLMHAITRVALFYACGVIASFVQSRVMIYVTQGTLRDLRGEKFIFHQTGQVAAQLCLEACRRAGFEPEIVCRSSSPTTGLYMVRGGLGVAFLPSEEFKSHAVDGVVELKLKEPIRKEVGVAWRKDAASPLLEEAIRFCRAWNR